jgi:hypothetical protein
VLEVEPAELLRVPAVKGEREGCRGNRVSRFPDRRWRLSERLTGPLRLGEPTSRRTSGGGLGVEIDVSENRRRAVEFRVNILRRSHGGKVGDNPAQAELRPTVRGLNRHTSRYRPKGGLMNDASFILTPAHYLVQIACERGWKTVAYLNDLEEAWRTMENVPDLRVFDTWKNAEVRLRDRPEFHRDQDLVGRKVKRISREVA